MNEKTVIDFLALQNKWWEDEKEFPFHRTYKFKRSDYYYLLENHLGTEEASVITGPRGIGKSTILLELIRELLGLPESLAGETDKKKIRETEIDPTADKKRILYVTFEESRFQKIELMEVLKIYSKYVLREDVSRLKGKIYVFLDEIQNVSNWGNQVKIIQDLKYPVKLFLSGSSSVAMKNESAKAARRVSTYSMHPLKLYDYLRYKINDEKYEEIAKRLKEFRKDFLRLAGKNSNKEIYERFMQFYSELKPWQTQTELILEEYMIKGGYPELLDEDNYVTCSTKLNQTFWLGFHKDIVLTKRIGNPGEVKELIEYISSISSWETNYTSLIEKSGATKNQDTLKKYLYHLENGFLIKISPKYKGGKGKSTNFKVYLVDIAIRNMLQGVLNELLLDNQTETELVIETMVYDHVVRLHQKIRPNMPLYYWKDREEVDIIMKLNGYVLPIEVKKSDNPSLSDVAACRSFARRIRQELFRVAKKYP